MNRLRQMIKDCPYGNKGCVPGDCVLCSEAPRGIRRECLEIIKQGVATQIFKELEEQFGLYSDGENGQLELDMIVIKPGDYYSTDDALERYQAIKEKHGVKE